MLIKARIQAAFLLAVIVVGLLMSVVPFATGGRLGIIAIEGNSLNAIPYGARVLVLPCRASPGDTVCAWGTLDRPETLEDARPGLMVKIYDGRRLVSTGTNDTSTAFEIRGKVVAVIPLQRLLPQLANLSCLAPAPGFPHYTAEQRLEIKRKVAWADGRRREFIKSGDAAWRKLDNTTVRADREQVRYINLPEPVGQLGIVCACDPTVEIVVCSGASAVTRLSGFDTGIRIVTAPAGKRLDYLKLVIHPVGDMPQRGRLIAIRKLTPQMAQACRETSL